MSIFDPPSDPYGDEKRCRICDEPLEYNPLIRGWECTHNHDEPESSHEDETFYKERKIAMKKIKIFEGTYIPDLEREINEYLEQNPKVDVLNLFATEVVWGNGAFQTVYLLVNEEE